MQCCVHTYVEYRCLCSMGGVMGTYMKVYICIVYVCMRTSASLSNRDTYD